MPSPISTENQGLSINNKILIPFVIVLIILGLTATIGSVQLISNAFSRETRHELQAAREIIAREVHEQEAQLYFFSDMLHSGQILLPESHALNDATEPIKVGDVQLSVKIVTSQSPEVLADPVLQQLMILAHRSDKAQIRLVSDRDHIPTITLVRPIADDPDRLLMLTSQLNREFLVDLATPLQVDAQILSLDNRSLVSTSDRAAAIPVLSEADLQAILSGTPVYKTTNSNTDTLHLFCAIPLGTTDLLILSLTRSMSNLKHVVSTLTTRSAITILSILLLGGAVFFKLLRRVMRPLDKLVSAIEVVSSGNLAYQVDISSKDEFGTLARSFNAMVNEIGTLYNQRVDQEKSLARVREELKYKELLEAKNREIERANHELRIHLEELSALFNLNQAMASSLELETLFDRIISVLKDLLHCNRIVLCTCSPDYDELVVRKSYGLDEETLQGTVFRFDEGITGKAALSREMIYIPDINTDDRNLSYKGRSTSEGSMVSAPMVIKNRLAGVLNLHKLETDAFTPVELKLVQAIANQAAVAIDNSQMYEKARNLSNTDELTGLANRRYFKKILQRELDQSLRFRSHFSLILADLDNFKAYNDTHGHLKGDLLLKQVSQILLQNTRGIDLVARFGGEEFVILLPKTDTEGARAAAEKLRVSVMTEKYYGIEKSHPDGVLTISLGIAEFPNDSMDIYELLDFADRALYRAKGLGKNRVVAWSEAISELAAVK
jgi:diguanylate cyclase (GGDEF)-like protein